LKVMWESGGTEQLTSLADSITKTWAVFEEPPSKKDQGKMMCIKYTVAGGPRNIALRERGVKKDRNGLGVYRREKGEKRTGKRYD